MPTWHKGQAIGGGGFATVHRVEREEDGAICAGKYLLPQWVANADILARFRREVSLQQLLQHPNIAPILESRLKENPPWFVMPLAQCSFLDQIAAGVTPDDAEAVFVCVLAAIEHAHGKDVVHRDLKPENVLIMPDGVVQVSDFGLGKNLLAASQALTLTTIGAGTYPYAAPEQVIDLASADARADIYALGKLLQVALTGHIPVLYDDPDVPPKYRFFINKCTEQRREDRYQSIADVIAAFDQVRRGVATPEAPREEFDRLVMEWTEAPAGPDQARIHGLDGLLERHAANQDFYRDRVPKIPPPMLETRQEPL